MHAGVNILNFGPTADPDAMLAWARFAERSGYDFAMISDHVVITPDVAEQYPEPFYDPLTTLAYLAGATETLVLGTTVLIVPYRHPLLTARMATTLDSLSGGRFILGVGVGWAEQEFDALGADFAARGAVTDDYLEVMLSTWGAEPHPPLWVGGNSLRAIRRAIRFGAAWHPISPAAGWLRSSGVPRLREQARAMGKRVPALAPRLHLEITDRPLPERHRLAGHGTLEQIAADIRELEDLGVQHVLFDTYDPNRHRDQDQVEGHWAMLDELAQEVLGRTAKA